MINILEQISQIPVSNGCRYYNKINKNIGIISDEFLYKSYKDAANFIYITPENYEKYIGYLDILIIASTWRGLKDEWIGLAVTNSYKRAIVFKIIQMYKKTKCKIVFYSKEDPVNYANFISIAEKCQYIFTTCQEVIPHYNRQCKNKNVYCLKFSINPIYHNPIGIKKVEKMNEVIFSGSWYNNRADRSMDMETIFNGVIDSTLGLRIIDRNYNLKNYNFSFPKKYKNYIHPQVNHEDLQKLHKLFNWAINLNTVKNSSTMFANRVYELQAIGNLIFSNSSTGMESLFPNIYVVNNKSDVKKILTSLNEEQIYEKQVDGIRRVMGRESTYERLVEMLKVIYPKYEATMYNLEKNILVVAKGLSDSVVESYNRQSVKNKNLILEDKLDDSILKKYDFVAYFDETKYYGEYYLEDMLNAFKYTNSDYITKDAYYKGSKLVKGIEHDYVNMVKDKYKTVFDARAFDVKSLEAIGKDEIIENGYSIDHFQIKDRKQISP